MSKIITDKNKIKELLERGVAEVIETKTLEQKLRSGKVLIVKLGIDPTSPNLHLGRSIPLLKLRDFQLLGHQIVFVVGDFTAVIGDTSDKDSERPMLSPAEIKKNLQTYIKQAAKIIDIKKAKIVYNSQWLKKLTYEEIGEQANVFSLAEFSNRENIKKRTLAGKRVSLREVLYPLMQGYDSVRLKADIELGGTDQRFNLLAGRQLQLHYQQKPQDILMTNLVEGTDGRKMSSSWGNTINLTDSSKDMFGKVMSLKDESIITYFIHCTRVSLNEVDKYQKQMAQGANPRDIKIKLAKALVMFYFNTKIADQEEQAFIEQFSKGNVPDDVATFSATSNTKVLEVLVKSGTVSSNSEARRLLKQQAIKVNQKKISDENFGLTSGDIIQIGKRKFLKIK